VYKALLGGLNDLSQCKIKKLRERSFTVFAGDAIGYDIFVLAVATESADLVNFVTPYFRKAPGYYTLESGSSRDFIPVFRYDRGYVIEYAEFGLEGTTYSDTDDFYGSGLTIYRRAYIEPEQAGMSKTCYGKLIKND
jgi:hypothetical protein